MIIKSCLLEKEFIQASFAIFYKNLYVKALIIIVLFISIVGFIAFALAPNNININIHISFSNFIPLLVIILLNLSVYNAAKKAYKPIINYVRRLFIILI